MLDLETVAADVFARHGIEFAGARRAGGWSNATWLAGGLALRLSTQPGSDRLHREALLAGLLPCEAGYPGLIDQGITHGLAWTLSREVQGICLGEIWPSLDWEERTTAVIQLWKMAQAVHRVDVQQAALLARQRAWYNSNDAAAADDATRRLAQQGLFNENQANAIRTALARFWSALPEVRCVLNHGDLTLDNALWDHGRVAALLDFEFAVIAPVQLDLNVLLSCGFGPEQDDSPGAGALRRTLAELAAQALGAPGAPELLLGYAVLLEQWKLEDWLAHPEGEGPLETWDPYRRLRSLADGQGGYLAPVLALAG